MEQHQWKKTITTIKATPTMEKNIATVKATTTKMTSSVTASKITNNQNCMQQLMETNPDNRHFRGQGPLHEVIDLRLHEPISRTY